MVGEREKWSGNGETAGTESERNAAAEPQTEARRCCGKSIAARDERADLRSGTGMVERVKGRPKDRAAQQTARWSRRIQIVVPNCLLVRGLCVSQEIVEDLQTAEQIQSLHVGHT